MIRSLVGEDGSLLTKWYKDSLLLIINKSPQILYISIIKRSRIKDNPGRYLIKSEMELITLMLQYKDIHKERVNGRCALFNVITMLVDEYMSFLPQSWGSECKQHRHSDATHSLTFKTCTILRPRADNITTHYLTDEKCHQISHKTWWHWMNVFSSGPDGNESWCSRNGCFSHCLKMVGCPRGFSID